MVVYSPKCNQRACAGVATRLITARWPRPQLVVGPAQHQLTRPCRRRKHGEVCQAIDDTHLAQGAAGTGSSSNSGLSAEVGAAGTDGSSCSDASNAQGSSEAQREQQQQLEGPGQRSVGGEQYNRYDEYDEDDIRKDNASQSYDTTPFNMTASERNQQAMLLPTTDSETKRVASGGMRAGDGGIGGGSEWRAVALYQLQRLLLGNIWTKIGAYFGLGVPAVAIGALALVTASEGRENLQDSMLKIYAALYKVPGVSVLYADPPAEDFVLNIFFFFGTFIFGIVLAVLIEELSYLAKDLRSGNFDLPIRGHTLVVGWSPMVGPLVKQIAMAQQERQGANLSGTLVVMADVPQAEMDSLMQVALRDHPKLSWYTRRGMPIALRDLQRCSAARAETVFVLRPKQGQDGADPSDQELSAILTLAACRSSAAAQAGLLGPLGMQRTVVQVPESLPAGERERWDAARALAAPPGGMSECSMVEGVRGVTRLMAQSAVQPGVASMVSQLLQHSYSGAEVYSRPCPLTRPMPFGAVRRMFTRTVLLGFATPALESAYAAEAPATVPVRGTAAAGNAGLNSVEGRSSSTNTASSSSSSSGGGGGGDTASSSGGRINDRGGSVVGGMGEGGGRLLLHVNPSDDIIVHPGDELLGLSQTLADFVPSFPTPGGVGLGLGSGFAVTLAEAAAAAALAQSAGAVGRRRLPARPQTIGVLAVAAAPLAVVVDHLLAYVAPGSTIVGFCKHLPDSLPSEEVLLERGVVYRHVGARPTDVDALHREGVAGFDSVVLMSSQERMPQSRMHDALLQSMVLSLQTALRRNLQARDRSKLPLHAVVSVKHCDTMEVIAGWLQPLPEGQLTVEFLQPTRLVAGWLVHMALGPAIGTLLRTFVEEGSLLSLVPAAAYVSDAIAAKRPVLLQELVERTRVDGNTALGFVSVGGMVRLAGCGESDAHVFGPLDKIVLLTGGSREVLVD